MAVLSSKHRYIFLAEPYCASRAIEEALLEQDGSERFNDWIHATFQELVNKGLLLPHEVLHRFSVVRHPADRAVTCYHHMTGWHSKGFDAFIRYHLENGIWDKTMFRHAQHADTCIRYEHLESQLNDVLEARGAPPVRLRQVGKTAGKRPWRSYFTKPLAQQFARQLQDFKRYGYTI